MATQGEYLVNNTVDDSVQLLNQLEQAKRLSNRIAQRMESLGLQALVGYVWPEGYTQADFLALYQLLDALPGLVVEDEVRDGLYKLVSSIQ